MHGDAVCNHSHAHGYTACNAFESIKCSFFGGSALKLQGGESGHQR